MTSRRRKPRGKESNLQKVIALVSGGVNSAVLLAGLMRRNYQVRALFIDDGKSRANELVSARKLAEYAGVPFEIADASTFHNKLRLLRDHQKALFLHAIASLYGEDDYSVASGYDAQTLSVNFTMQLSKMGIFSGANILIAPFAFKTKQDAIITGEREGVPFELTWTCEENRELHCGRCQKCEARISAFFLAGVPDPAIYETDLSQALNSDLPLSADIPFCGVEGCEVLHLPLETRGWPLVRSEIV
jgi:7-cyano-7-deazaguanine synthase